MTQDHEAILSKPHAPFPRIGLFSGTPVYVLGKCKRRDEGIVGHDVQCRPYRMGIGKYTFVTAPDAIEYAP